jgi:hypothetical protein
MNRKSPGLQLPNIKFRVPIQGMQGHMEDLGELEQLLKLSSGNHSIAMILFINLQAPKHQPN